MSRRAAEPPVGRNPGSPASDPRTSVAAEIGPIFSLLEEFRLGLVQGRDSPSSFAARQLAVVALPRADTFVARCVDGVLLALRFPGSCLELAACPGRLVCSRRMGSDGVSLSASTNSVTSFVTSRSPGRSRYQHSATVPGRRGRARQGQPVSPLRAETTRSEQWACPRRSFGRQSRSTTRRRSSSQACRAAADLLFPGRIVPSIACIRAAR